jgi:hypothetical protein
MHFGRVKVFYAGTGTLRNLSASQKTDIRNLRSCTACASVPLNIFKGLLAGPVTVTRWRLRKCNSYTLAR